MAISIARQRALARAGNIRMGEVRKSKGGKPYPATRDTWRFTSPNRPALDMLQKTYGGTIRPWEAEPGQWELDSEAVQISVIVDTTFSVDEQFTRYDGKTRTHRCDGINCQFVELRRGPDRKIVFCEDRGVVPCLCDPEGYGAELEDDERACDLSTTLRVMIPCTKDVVLWQFASKGKIFNQEVFGAIETFKQMGIRQGYCHLTIHHLTKTVGNDVSRFGVARLTLDPNPPNFVRELLANTPAAQAQAILEGANVTAPALPGGQASAKALVATGASQTQAGSSKAELARAYLANRGWDVDTRSRFATACKERQVSWTKIALDAQAGDAAAEKVLCDFVPAASEVAEADPVIEAVFEEDTAAQGVVDTVAPVEIARRKAEGRLDVDTLYLRLKLEGPDAAKAGVECEVAGFSEGEVLQAVYEELGTGIEAVMAKIREWQGQGQEGLGL